MYGTLHLLDYVELLLANYSNHSELQLPSASFTCTDCLVEAYKIIDQDPLTKGLIDSDTRRQITTQCMGDLYGMYSMGNRVDLLGAK